MVGGVRRPLDGVGAGRTRRRLRSSAGRASLLVGLGAALLLGALSLIDRLVAAHGWDYAPLRSHADSDNEMIRSEFSVRVVTNRLGFREPRLPGPKPEGTIRIVVVGDSFTQGYGVAEEQAYPRRLQALLGDRAGGGRYEVVNLGVPAACPLDYVHHLRDPGLAYACPRSAPARTPSRA